MNCRAFEPLIALYAGRDLDDPRQVEEHLAECPECRQLLEDLQSNQAALKEWASDPVDGAFLTAVRSGVLARVENRRPRVWPWVAALSTAVAIIFVAMPRQQVPPPPPPAPLVAQVPTPIAASRPAPRRKRVVRRKAEPLVVKMLTDDPDIVIIWLTGD